MKAPLADRAVLHIGNFDFLRLLFASMVVLFHIGILSASSALVGLTRFSATFAVQAFFFVSGFLVVMSYDRTASMVAYFKKRFLRIFPAYIFVVVGAAVCLSLASVLTFSQYFSSPTFWRYLGFNLLLSNFSAPALPGVFTQNLESAANASLWTIKIEVAFYCVVPLIVWAVRRWGAGRALGAIFVFSLAWRFGLTALTEATHREIFAKLAKQLPGQLSFFVGGAWAYYRSVGAKPAPRLWMVVVALAAYWLAEGELFLFIAPFAVTAIVYWLAIAGPRLWSPARYGDFSYGIYLYHFPVVQVFIAAGFFAVHPYATTLGVLCIVVVLACASWFFVERPFIQKKKLVEIAS